jgi:hypothetical protein
MLSVGIQSVPVSAVLREVEPIGGQWLAESSQLFFSHSHEVLDFT